MIKAIGSSGFGVGSGGLAAVNNLSDVANAGSALSNLGGQPLDADLTNIAALATTSYGRALLTVANQAALQAVVGSTSSYPAATLAEAQAGTSVDLKSWTPARIKDAIVALAAGAGGSLSASQNLADLANTVLALSNLGAQPYSANLDAIASVASTIYGRSVLTVANQAGLRALVGAGTGTVNFSGTYSPSTTYSPNQIVIAPDGKTYICVTATTVTGQQPPNVTHWTLLSGNINFTPSDYARKDTFPWSYTIQLSPDGTAQGTGGSLASFVMPHDANLNSIVATNKNAGSLNPTTIQIRRQVGVFGTPVNVFDANLLTIDINEFSSLTSSVQPGQLVSTLTAGDKLLFDVYNTSTNTRGIQVTISGTRNTTSIASAVTAPLITSSLAAGSFTSSSISLSWSFSDGNSIMQSVRVYRSTASNMAGQVLIAEDISSPINMSTATDTGLSVSTVYYYQLQLVNSIGTTLSSIVSASTTATSAIPAQTGAPDVYGTSQASSNITWTVASNNGFTITSQVVQLAEDAGFTVGVRNYPTFLPTSYTYGFQYLDSGKTYYVRVLATNVNGTSTGLTSSFSTTLVGTNMANPTSVTIGTKTVSTIPFSWTAPAAGSSALVAVSPFVLNADYNTVYGLQDSVVQGAFDNTIPLDTSFTASGLFENQTVYVGVKFVDANGNEKITPFTQVTTVSTGASRPATISTFTSVSYDSSNKIWIVDVPTPSNGGQAITFYQFYVSTDASGNDVNAYKGTTSIANNTPTAGNTRLTFNAGFGLFAQFGNVNVSLRAMNQVGFAPSFSPSQLVNLGA